MKINIQNQEITLDPKWSTVTASKHFRIAHLGKQLCDRAKECAFSGEAKAEDVIRASLLSLMAYAEVESVRFDKVFSEACERFRACFDDPLDTES